MEVHACIYTDQTLNLLVWNQNHQTANATKLEAGSLTINATKFDLYLFENTITTPHARWIL